MRVFLLSSLGLLALSAAFLATGCKKSSTTEPPESTKPISGGNDIGRGGDPAAMAVRRGAEMTQHKGELVSLGQYYTLYINDPDSGNPTAEGFKTFILRDPNAQRSLHPAIREGRYELVVRRGAPSTAILAYEKTADYRNNRLVVRVGGAVENIPDQQLQTELRAQGS